MDIVEAIVLKIPINTKSYSNHKNHIVFYSNPNCAN